LNRERGQALILVLILLAVGSLMIVPFLQLTHTVLKGRMMYAQFIKEDYAVDAAIEYSLWRLNWESGFADNMTVGDNATFEVTLNGVTANITITMHTIEWLSGEGLEGKHQVKLTKEVTPATALPDVPTTFTYIITVQRLEPDDAIFVPLQSIKDGMDEGFVYVPDSSELDGVPFDDDDLTILQEPVIIEPMNTIAWSTTADMDSMVSQVSPDQNYGSELTMDVSSGVPSGNQTARSFVYFDISSLPADGVIHSATLTLWAESYPDATRTYDVHPVTDNWTGAIINWNNQPAVAATATDSSPTPSDNSTPMEWDVLADLQDWVDGIETNYGWRVSDDAEEIGTEVYTVTVNDTLEFDTDEGRTPSITPVSGDVYAIAYDGEAGPGSVGYLKTVQITSSGNITDTVIDTLEFDAVKGKTPDIINISGDIYAIAYAGDGDDGLLKTVEIAASGNITDTVIDELEFDTLKGLEPSIIPISGDIYAIAYAGDGDDGFLKTVEIAANGQITNTVIGTLEFDAVKGKTPDIINVSGDVYAVAYAGPDDDGFLKTVQIASSGQIINTVIDTLEFDTDAGKTPVITNVSGDVYAIVYNGKDDDGFLKTVDITDDGNILDTVTNTPEFDPEKGKELDIIHISGDVYAIAYAGRDDDGFLKTVDLVAGSAIEHTTVFIATDDNNPGGTEPILTIYYDILGGTALQTIEWIFEPDLDFSYGQERTLSFQAKATLPDNSRWWNAAQIEPNGSYTGMTANITVGSPTSTQILGSGLTIDKTADPLVVYAGIPTVVTYVISITNSDNVSFDRLDRIIDYLPEGFLLIEGSSTAEWPDHNSLENDRPGYPYNNGCFEPEVKMENGRQKLDWHDKDLFDIYPPYSPEDKWNKLPADIALHDYTILPGVTYTLTFQALATVEVSGNYPNEVFTKLKDDYGRPGLDLDDMVYSWPTGEVVVPAYDILTETEYSTLRTNAAITLAGITLRSWVWKKHK